MAKSLGNDKDVKTSIEAGESTFKRPLKIPAAETPWRLLGLDYEDGFVHYIRTPSSTFRVVCLGGPEGNGFAPDDCPICGHMLEMYNEAKEIRAEEGEESVKAKRIKDEANGMRAKYEAHFLAIRGARIVERNQKGQLVKTAIFEQIEGAENEDIEAGIFSLTHAQYRNLVALVNDDKVPQINSGGDLIRFTLWTTKVNKKGQRGEGKYQEVQWNASSRPSDCPLSDELIEALKEEFDLGEGFQIDADYAGKVIKLLTGKVTGGSDDDVELDDEVVESKEEPTEADLADEDPVEEDGAEGEDIASEDILGDVEDGEDFEDDMPDEPEPKKAAPKKAAPVSTKGKRRI